MAPRDGGHATGRPMRLAAFLIFLPPHHDGANEQAMELIANQA